MKKLDLKSFNRIFGYVKPNKPFYSAMLSLDCLIEISLIMLLPITIKLGLDAAVKGDIQLIKKGLIITLAVSLAGMGLFAISQFYFFRSSFLTTANVRRLLLRTILNLPVEYIEKHHSGDTLSRLTNDIDKMEDAYSWPLRMMIVNLLNGFTSAMIMFIMDWKLSIILLLISSVSVIINIRQKDILRKYNDVIQKEMGRYTENLSNMIGGFMTIKSLQFEKLMLDRAEEINGNICKSNVELAKKSSFIQSRNALFNAINFLSIILLGSYLALKGISNLGAVAAMMILLGRVNRMFEGINDMIVQMQGFLAGADRVNELLDTQTEQERIDMEAVDVEAVDVEAVGKECIDGGQKSIAIAMQDIRFSYDGQNNALEGISLKVGKGQVAALVGPSGGGKSTIVKLILGYYSPASGKMTIHGEALKKYTVAELRSLIAYVPQDAYVFDGTILENIRYGRMNATAEEIIAAAKAAYADEFIREMAEGYDTLVGERGIKLSGGQRQRIAIARAFLKDAPILLLDEATSSLDSQSEQQVQDALNTLMIGKTSLIIAHRLSTIEHADVIYLVDNGKVAEQGTHDELIENGAMYRMLYERQFRISEQLVS